MRALLVGLGGVQAELMRRLQAGGWWVAGCSHRAEGPGLDELDHFEPIDVRDADGVTALARRHEATAVYSAGMELPMEAVAVARRRLGQTEWFPAEAARLVRHKPSLRGLLAARGLSPVACTSVRSLGDLDDWDHYPAVVKPADSAGQRGVFVAGSRREIAAGLGRTLSFSPTGEALVEEWLEGPEVSANAFILEGRLVFCRLSDRLTVAGVPGGIPRAHVLPSRAATGQQAAAVRHLLGQLAAALGIRRGPLYAQLILTTDGPRLIEASPRLDGCHLWRLIRWVTGVDLLAAVAGLLAGEDPVLEEGEPSPAMTLGMLHRLPGVAFRAEDDTLPAATLECGYHYREGEVVRPVNGVLETVGFYLLPEG